MSVPARPNPAAVQVICLGHSRTGVRTTFVQKQELADGLNQTSSMAEALNMLGFGPCHHGFNSLKEGKDEWLAWCKIFHGPSTPEDFDVLLRGYRSALDQPVALFPAELYAAYPDAKFILTTRDPAKWEASMKATLFPGMKAIRASKVPLFKSLNIWCQTCLLRYHGGRLYSHPQEALLYHEEHVKRTIPPEKLLVYQVGEGWDRLVQFLGVPKPDTPFPHLNDAANFQEVTKKLGVDVNWDDW